VPARTISFLRENGFRTTLRKIRAHVNNARFDRRYGVHSDEWVAVSDLNVVGDHQALGANCQPIKPLAFKAAMEAFDLPRDGVFVDFGSGAGRALMMAVLAGFDRVVGVEFATDICTLASKNLKSFRARTGRDFEFRILNLDATAYEVGDEDSVFFFYNPFDRPVLDEVLTNIRWSVDADPRPIHVVYGRPLQRRALDDDPFWAVVAETDAGGLEDFVHYRPR
jgi:hypothetical protein